MNRIKTVLNNENGSPMIETLIAISVALAFVIALGGLGGAIIYWVAGAKGAVTSLN
jgi:Flp pilus assembly pilin Flp